MTNYLLKKRKKIGLWHEGNRNNNFCFSKKKKKNATVIIAFQNL